MPLKDESQQQQVPAIWRPIFREVVEAFRSRDFSLERRVDGVAPIEQDDSEDIAAHIDAYGETLVTLPDEAWQTSVCRWQLSYWDVLIDLFTLEEGISDLVLFARVFQREDGYEFRINSVHVP